MTRKTFGEIVWGWLPNGAVEHAFDTGEESETSLCGLAGLGRRAPSQRLAKCRRCVKAQAEPFAATEEELSTEARAILEYARKWGAPFTRLEITAVAPGAAWDVYSRYPSTVAKLDPIRELVRAGLAAELDEQPTKPDKRGKVKHYKRWVLTDAVQSLPELLDTFAEAVRTLAGGAESAEHAERAKDDRDAIRAEIVRRFGRG